MAHLIHNTISDTSSPTPRAYHSFLYKMLIKKVSDLLVACLTPKCYFMPCPYLSTQSKRSSRLRLLPIQYPTQSIFNTLSTLS